MKGFKTYLAAALGVAATGAYAMKYIDRDQYELIAAAVGFGGLAALRAGVSREQTRPNQRRILRQGLDPDKTKVEP